MLITSAATNQRHFSEIRRQNKHRKLLFFQQSFKKKLRYVTSETVSKISRLNMFVVVTFHFSVIRTVIIFLNKLTHFVGQNSVQTDKELLAEKKMGGGREDFCPRVHIFCIFLNHCSEVTVAEKYARKTRPHFFSCLLLKAIQIRMYAFGVNDIVSRPVPDRFTYTHL